MASQNYNNHVRWYIPHHFIFYPLVATGFFFSGSMMISKGDIWIWAAILFCLFLIAFVAFMMRQHYGLGNQNRIVRLEMRFRYFVLTQKRLELLEDKLSFGQIAALRFASDEELPALTDRAVGENLSPDAIKKAIKTWQPDYLRV